jgi:hypothetical protein
MTCESCNRPVLYAKAYFAGRAETMILDPIPDKSGNVRLTGEHSCVLMGEGQALAYHVKGERVFRQHGFLLCSYYQVLNMRRAA